MRIYKRLASLISAIANCKVSGNQEWLEKHTEAAEKIVEVSLPSGSGFDSGSSIDFDKSKPDRLVLGTSFHHMDEHGGYDGWTEHEVIVTPSLAFGFDLRVTGRNRNQIKDLIVESFEFALNSETKL